MATMKTRIVDVYRTYDSKGDPFHTYYRYEVYDSEKKYWKRELPCIEIGEILIGEDLKGNTWWLNSRTIAMEQLMNSLFGDTYMSYQTSNEMKRDLDRLYGAYRKLQIEVKFMERKVIYIHPDYDEIEGITLDEIKDMPKDELLSWANNSNSADVFSLEGFEWAFNNERISDMGFIFFV